MKSTNFIKNKLNNLIENFPQLKVRYELDNVDNTHIIEVLPSIEFNNNINYSKFETEIIIDFTSKYPYEEIIFITENSLIEITKPLFEKKGCYYDNTLEVSTIIVNNIEATNNKNVFNIGSHCEYLIVA